jgi:hypothetical protein
MNPAAFLNDPTAVQFPSDAHDTELKRASGLLNCAPLANSAGVGSPHVPFDADAPFNPNDANINRPTTNMVPPRTTSRLKCITAPASWITNYTTLVKQKSANKGRENRPPKTGCFRAQAPNKKSVGSCGSAVNATGS